MIAGASVSPVSRSTGYDYDTFAEDLHQLITQLDLHKVVLVGMSMGGGEVARYLGKYGSKHVSKAVFISRGSAVLAEDAGQSGGGGQERLRWDAGQHREGPAGLSVRLLRQFLQHRCAAGQACQRRGGAGQLEHRRRTPRPSAPWRACPPGTPISATTCHASTCPRWSYTAIKTGSVPINATGIRTHKAIKGSQLVVVEGAPHGMLWTHAEQVNRALTDFLGQSAQARAA